MVEDHRDKKKSMSWKCLIKMMKCKLRVENVAIELKLEPWM